MNLPDDATIEAGICKAIVTVKPSLANFPINDQTRFVSLSLESIELISVAFELEDAFGITIVDRQLDQFRTVAEAHAVVKKLLLEKASA